ncbi:Uncharacterised protein [Vibrio cholerae]|nr:Uncharacterised protein [Vibrio cholerae]CSD10488.1 Uncharacterised protein [Vibrio cholerae]CSD46260.1 Uncharacterised protein [Vibrio cholerae]
MATRCRSPRFSNFPTFTLWIVFRVYRDKSRNAETALILFTNFRTRTFWCHHHNRDVFTDLHALFNDIKTV